MWFAFLVLGVAIAFSLAADQVQNTATLWLAASVAWLGIMWFAIAKA